MTSLNFLLTLAIIVLAHGQEVQESKKNCGTFQLMKEDMRCVFKQVSFSKDLLMLAWSDFKQVDKFRQACSSLQECYASLECRKNDKTYVEVATNMQGICDGLLYLSTDFVECKKKIDSLEDKCEVGEKCETIFGENNCAKPRIIEQCGKEQWETFREAVINIRKSRIPECNFDQYRD
ncbi:Protein CBG00790 [Caenorhabditis briggsae]|uniref:T20D4.11-like domain-containing protein n=2 Tax=Caenorhabditis briggsae TaxID=6238 RepID=A0AAE9CXD3_CAEBR|nr:Protein CBG00790 [Caenorhabditis briggsae]ULT86401.1 hypothetical protein L3Y34_006234 [Caenorhabditis briggsae]UMM32161.1 hypothetical protein L5515_006061 [Caenorhabditis briggsae]CAP22148.1 Protein CBG00790 [Caenorhabditis briggsae]